MATRMATSVDVDEMIANLPKDERLIVERLRALVFECLPKAEEKAYYGLAIPFYRHHRLICFIWPASVFWTPAHPKGQTRGTSLGFSQGNLMSNEKELLLSEGRKQVYVMYFQKLSDINDDDVRALLFEAGMIDDHFGEQKKKKRPGGLNKATKKPGLKNRK